jgi:8-oxo-dGTP diphosphatase
MQQVTAAVIVRDGRILIARRKSDDRFGGVWEFPGGKLEKGENPEHGLRRELQEELGIEVEIGPFLGAFPFQSPVLGIELLAYRASFFGDVKRLTDHDEIRWVSPGELKLFEFSDPDLPVVFLLSRSLPVPGQNRGGEEAS